MIPDPESDYQIFQELDRYFEIGSTPGRNRLQSPNDN